MGSKTDKIPNEKLTLLKETTSTIVVEDGEKAWYNNSSNKNTELHPLELKYGKEPKISAKELAQSRWNWH